MQPNEIYNILTLKKMYLRKDSQLVSFSFPFSLIKKIKRPGKVPGEGLSKQKLFELSGDLEYLFQRAPLSTDRKARHPPGLNMLLTALPVSAPGVLFDPSVFSPELSHHSTSEVPSTGFL